MADDLFTVYDDILKRSQRMQRPQQLSGAIYTAADADPDAEAGLHKLAQKVGMPVEALRVDHGAEAKRRAALLGVESLPVEAPKVSEFVVEPGNAALVHDDLDNLSALEKLLKSIATVQTLPMRGGMAMGSGAVSPAQVSQAFRSGREQQQQGRLAHQQLTGGAVDSGEMDRLSVSVQDADLMISRTKDYGFLTAAQIAGQMFESGAKAFPLALSAGMTAGGVAAAVGQAGPQVALPEEVITIPAAFAGAFGAALTYGFLDDTRRVEAGHAYMGLADIRGENGETIDENTAALTAQTVGLVNAAIEGVGLKIITAPYKAALKRVIMAEAAKTAAKPLTRMAAARAAGRFATVYGTQVGAEVGQEILQETTNVVAEEIAKAASAGEFERATPEEVGARLWEIASKTAQGMAWLGLPGAGVSLNNDLQAARAARKNAEFIGALGDTAKASKLRERLPAKFQELVAKIKEGGAIDNVFVPAEQWRTFWQERGVDPEAVAQQVGADYVEALAIGGDISIPLESYAAQLAGTEYHKELMRDVRLRQGEMTLREAEAFDAERNERFSSLLSEAEMAEQPDDSSRRVYEDVFGQLIGSGRERATAEREALLAQKNVNAWAKRLGRDAWELYQENPYEIRRDIPQALRRGTIDTDIDPILDRLRAGESPTDRATFGKSLLEFLRERGIADDRGDLAGMDVDSGRKPFTRKLLRADGMTLDRAGEALWEAGYFAERPTTREILDAVDAELRGEPVYAASSADEQAMGARADLDEMRRYLDAAGIDLATMDNAAVRAALWEVQSGDMQAGGTFNQAGADSDRLSVLHSLTSENLIFADEMGGLAVPSLAVVPGDMAMQGYGDITLIGTKELADPEQTPVFDADAYTTTFPLPDYPKVKSKDAMKVVNEFRPFIDKFDQTREHVDTIFDNAVNSPDPAETIRRLEMANSAKAMFLAEQGVDVEPVLRTKNLHFDFSDTKALREFFKTKPDVNMDHRSPEHKALSEAALQALDEYLGQKQFKKLRNDLRETYQKTYFDEDGYLFYGKLWLFFDDQRNLGKQELDPGTTRQALDAALVGKEAQFQSWLHDKIIGMYGEPFLKVGRDKLPYTLDSIVRVMTSGRQLAGAEDTMVFGEGKARAVAAHRFKNLEEMRALAKENILPPAEIEAAREEAKELMEQWRTAVVEHYTVTDYRGTIDTWGGLDASMRAVAKWAKSKTRNKTDLNAALRREKFANVPDSVLELGVKAGKALLTAPVPYFESKPQRAVKLSEFAGAVVPSNPDQRVVAILEKNDIPFVEYGDRYDEKARSAAVDSMRQKLAAEGKDVLFQTFAEGKRGSITFGPNSRIITLMKDADTSTVIHEFGHSWLEDLKRFGQREDSPQQVKDDWAIIASDLGLAADVADIPVAAHERFADTAYNYVMEGKAPSIDLQPVFQRFKVWLLALLRQMRINKVEMSDEVRGVFDRLLATEEEIQQARQSQGFAPIFANAADMGYTEREFAAYRQDIEQAHAKAETDLQQKLMAELTREQAKWWKEERSKVRAEVEAEAKENPVYQAFQALTTGTDFDGNAVEGFKLSRAALVKMYGEPFVKKLPRAFHRVYVKEGGMHPDVVAEMFGFSSGDEMVRQMANTPPMKQAVEAETDARMRRTHGDMLNDGTLADEAIRAVHSDYQGQVLRAELRALRRKQREVAPYVAAARASDRDAERAARTAMEASIPPLQAFRAWAAQTVGAKQVKDLRPDLYLKAEQKAGRLAFEAAARKDYRTAGEEKQKQLLNHYLYLESVKTKEESEIISEFMLKMEKPRAQSVLGKAGVEYQDAMNSILEQHEFRKVSNRELNYRESLSGLAQRMADDGRDPSLIENLQGSFVINYRSMSIEQLRSVYHAAKFIYHNAKTAHDWQIKEQRHAKEVVRREVIGSIMANAAKTQSSMEKKSGWAAVKEATWDFIANSLTADTILFRLDGWRRLGPVHRYIKGMIDEAIATELLPMQDKAAREVEKIYAVYSPAELREMANTKIYVPELGGSFTKLEIIDIAQNQGNDGNREALVTSRVALRTGLTQQKVEALLDRLLDERDWNFVQARIDYLETFWPKISEKHLRIKGIVPKKVEPTPIVTRYGVLKGGYWPLKYDAGKSVNAAQDAAEDFFTNVRQGRFSWAHTADGHTIARVGSGGRAVDLSGATFHTHINEVITDLALGEPVHFAASVLNDAQIKAAFEDTDAVNVRRYLDVWLTDTAMGERVGSDVASRVFRRLRTGIAAKSMLFNVGVGLIQWSGLLQTAGTIGLGNTARGVKALLADPFKAGGKVAAMSPFMAKREDTFHKDIMDLVKSFKSTRTRQFIDFYGMYMIKKFQHHVDVATWLGAYYQAETDSDIDADPVAYADRMVARAQASGLFSDRSAVERGSFNQQTRQSEVVRAMTTLLSYQIAKFNVAVEKVGRTDFRNLQSLVSLAGDVMLLYVFDTMVVMLMTGAWPDDDDDESWMWKLFTRSAGSAASAVVGGRDIVSAIEGFPSGGAFGTLGEAINRVVVQIDQGEIDAPLLKSINNLGGILFRYPSAAINRFGDALSRDLDGEDVALIEYFVYQERDRK